MAMLMTNHSRPSRIPSRTRPERTGRRYSRGHGRTVSASVTAMIDSKSDRHDCLSGNAANATTNGMSQTSNPSHSARRQEAMSCPLLPRLEDEQVRHGGLAVSVLEVV